MLRLVVLHRCALRLKPDFPWWCTAQSSFPETIPLAKVLATGPIAPLCIAGNLAVNNLCWQVGWCTFSLFLRKFASSLLGARQWLFQIGRDSRMRRIDARLWSCGRTLLWGLLFPANLRLVDRAPCGDRARKGSGVNGMRRRSGAVSVQRPDGNSPRLLCKLRFVCNRAPNCSGLPSVMPFLVERWRFAISFCSKQWLSYIPPMKCTHLLVLIV